MTKGTERDGIYDRITVTFEDSLEAWKIHLSEPRIPQQKMATNGVLRGSQRKSHPRLVDKDDNSIIDPYSCRTPVNITLA